MVVDPEGKELEKVECPKCKGAVPSHSEEKKERKAPGEADSTISLCSLCHGEGWIWRRKEESSA